MTWINNPSLHKISSKYSPTLVFRIRIERSNKEGSKFGLLNVPKLAAVAGMN